MSAGESGKPQEDALSGTGKSFARASRNARSRTWRSIRGRGAAHL